MPVALERHAPASESPVAGYDGERRRRTLRDFLMARRARLEPADVGLPITSRRRVDGLRRDEVAELIGVSVDWYRWFESGRDVRVSPKLIGRLARALSRARPAHRTRIAARRARRGVRAARARHAAARQRRRPRRLQACRRVIPTRPPADGGAAVTSRGGPRACSARTMPGVPGASPRGWSRPVASASCTTGTLSPRGYGGRSGRARRGRTRSARRRTVAPIASRRGA